MSDLVRNVTEVMFSGEKTVDADSSLSWSKTGFILLWKCDGHGKVSLRLKQFPVLSPY